MSSVQHVPPGAVHHAAIRPRLPLNNRLALHSCDIVFTEIDFNDHNLLSNYDQCMVLACPPPHTHTHTHTTYILGP